MTPTRVLRVLSNDVPAFSNRDWKPALITLSPGTPFGTTWIFSRSGKASLRRAANCWEYGCELAPRLLNPAVSESPKQSTRNEGTGAMLSAKAQARQGDLGICCRVIGAPVRTACRQRCEEDGRETREKESVSDVNAGSLFFSKQFA
jgi:hypothetical protein